MPRIDLNKVRCCSMLSSVSPVQPIGFGIDFMSFSPAQSYKKLEK